MVDNCLKAYGSFYCLIYKIKREVRPAEKRKHPFYNTLCGVRKAVKKEKKRTHKKKDGSADPASSAGGQQPEQAELDTSADEQQPEQAELNEDVFIHFDFVSQVAPYPQFL